MLEEVFFSVYFCGALIILILYGCFVEYASKRFDAMEITMVAFLWPLALFIIIFALIFLLPYIIGRVIKAICSNEDFELFPITKEEENEDGDPDDDSD